MGKINLSEDDLKILSESINDETELPQDLLMKLSPGFFEKLSQAGKFDFKELDKHKIPTIEYAGKRAESVILAQAAITGAAAPLQVERCFSGGKLSGQTQLDLFEQAQKPDDPNWQNMIVQGDNLQFLKTCYVNQDPLIKDKVKRKVKLIYIDPPFGTGDEYGGGSGQRSYSAKLMGAEFIENLRERLIYLKEILSNDGSIFIRIDYHFGHYIKVLMDEIFDYNNFKNEIVINRFKRMLKGLKQFNVATDSLYYYSKSNINIFNEIEKKRICSFCNRDIEPVWRGMSSPGLRNPPERNIFGKTLLPPRGRHWTFRQERVDELILEERIRVNSDLSYVDLNGNRVEGLPEYLQTEAVPIDSNWTDLKGYVFAAKYPTENPEELLERVITSASNKGDLILDCFAGSGTTSAVAEKLGRRWIACDFGKHSIYHMQKRIIQIPSSKAIGSNLKKNQKYGTPAKPFCVISTGAYDFSRIMSLKQNKDAYLSFVLGLFNITPEKIDYSKKYKLSNIFAEKNNNPVEVYPVWEDEYLKNIRIDGDYLKGIINAAGGKLKGDYYIITPETCTIITDTTMKNGNNEEVNFKLLKFPYKVLEDVSRQFQIEEQPSSEADINKLISSSAFYFNQKVKVKVAPIKDGFKITEFETGILSKNKQRFDGLDGLTMILIDKNYDGKVFSMDIAVYKKEITDDGVVKISGLTDKSFLIAIDKHGNESKIVNIKP